MGPMDSWQNTEDFHAREIQRQVLRYQPRGKRVVSPRLSICGDAWTLEAGLRGGKAGNTIAGEKVKVNGKVKNAVTNNKRTVSCSDFRSVSCVSSVSPTSN